MQASLDPAAFATDYRQMFAPGRIVDRDLDRRIVRLHAMFARYAAGCPAPFWAPGLRLSGEIVRITETFLDSSAIRCAFQLLVRTSVMCEFCPPIPCFDDRGWLGFLENLPLHLQNPNPAALLSQIVTHEDDRIRFLFAAFLPGHYGGAFARYPGQLDSIRELVAQRRAAGSERISCLDAACGSGEGSYELAAVLQDCGYDPDRIGITGVTINPLELFAAAHAFFPHDPNRQQEYRRFVAGIHGGNRVPAIQFEAGDVLTWGTRERFGLIICNGILGGPMLNNLNDIETVMGRLAACLEPGGVLLAADRFHGGWKKRITDSDMEQLLRRCGLVVIKTVEGIAGLKRQDQN